MANQNSKKTKNFNNNCGGNFKMKMSKSGDRFFDFKIAGNNYTLFKEAVNFRRASKLARKMGGYLAEEEKNPPLMMETYNVYKKIVKHLSDDEITDTTSQRNAGDAAYVWLGGSDKKKEGDWRWLRSNDPIERKTSYGGNWGSNPFNPGLQEPDNYKGEQHHLALALESWPREAGQSEQLGVSGQWNDISEKNKLYFVIEYDNPVCDLF